MKLTNIWDCFIIYLTGEPVSYTHLQAVKDKYIPAILGLIGCVLAAVYVVATCPLGNVQEIAMAVFTAIVQGILVAGLSTYVNQLAKQRKKQD